ncbi:MAG: heavy-metal-associated domain-containing protein [Xenococcaceae cyanobacterium]
MNLQLKVSSIVCSGCIDTITKAVKDVDPDAIVDADTQTKLVKIETNKPSEAIEQAIVAVGHQIS